MKTIHILLGIIAAAALIVLAAAYVCYRMAFCVSKKQARASNESVLPPGKIYEPYHDTMLGWIKQTKALPHEDVSITSFDGLTLRGKYYEYAPGAPIELMMPGYRGLAQRDLCGGVQRCFKLERSALIVDQRACGTSDGSVITFGVNEHKDCLAWVDFLINHMGPGVKIILTGISMGATTVLLASGTALPENVIGVIADCGYTSAREIIKKVIKDDMKLPSDLAYPFVRLGARLFGHFDLEVASAVTAVKNCRVPVFFIHGEADDFVPCSMSVANYEACASAKKLLTVPGAGHGLGYIADPDAYMKAISELPMY